MNIQQLGFLFPCPERAKYNSPGQSESASAALGQDVPSPQALKGRNIPIYYALTGLPLRIIPYPGRRFALPFHLVLFYPTLSE